MELRLFDISFHTNLVTLLQLLKQDDTVYFFDHYFAGEIPESPLFHSHIDTSLAVCTGILVDRFLAGQYRLWAIVESFGDSLHSPAHGMADTLKLSHEETEELRELGELINYNDYGETVGDLHYSPKALFMAVQPYSDTFDFFMQPEN